MRILIVGNDPHDVGGVANYTRPLATTFTRLGHEVDYLYSGAWNRVYNWRMRPYLRRVPSAHPFACHELVNSPNWPYQFGSPRSDISMPEADAILRAFLAEVRPQVIHVHSRVGLPGSIFIIAHELGIPVFNTLHVYGMLCQRRVMIDVDGEICPGPTSMEKCARCTGTLPIPALKTLARIGRTSVRLADTLVATRRALLRLRPGQNGENTLAPEALRPLAEGLADRLAFMVDTMNNCIQMNLCVSRDVKATLMRFGVMEERLKVQHIGSIIAEKQVIRRRAPGRPLAIGNIGGVTYYKGTHVLVKAAQRLQAELGSEDAAFKVDVFGGFDADYMARLQSEFPQAPVRFHGRYKPEQLPEILDQIDVLVLPSICADTAPQTIFEGFSRGVPVVASDSGGFPDFIVDRENGRLFPAGDDNTLTAILAELVRDPAKLIGYSEHIPALKTISRNAIELLELYCMATQANAKTP